MQKLAPQITNLPVFTIIVKRDSLSLSHTRTISHQHCLNNSLLIHLDFWKRRGQTRVALGQNKGALADLTKYAPHLALHLPVAVTAHLDLFTVILFSIYVHSLIDSHSFIRSCTHSHSHNHSLAHPSHSLSPLTLSLTPTHSFTLSHSLTHSFKHTSPLSSLQGDESQHRLGHNLPARVSLLPNEELPQGPQGLLLGSYG